MELASLTDLFLFPAKAFLGLLYELYDHAENELYNESKIRQELSELEGRIDRGEITEEEYEECEQLLLERLQEARRRRREEEEADR